MKIVLRTQEVGGVSKSVNRRPPLLLLQRKPDKNMTMVLIYIKW